MFLIHVGVLIGIGVQLVLFVMCASIAVKGKVAWVGAGEKYNPATHVLIAMTAVSCFFSLICTTYLLAIQ